MLKSRIIFCIAFVLLAIHASAARAANVIVGVNVEDIGRMNEQQQDSLLNQLKMNGVSTIRTGILHQGLLEDNIAHFIFGASKLGMQTVLIVFPHMGGTDRHTAPANPAMGLPWPVPALSNADPDGFKKWIAPQMAALESANVRLAAFELGNEFNTPGFNGDFPTPGSGRILSVGDLNNASDAEANGVANGYRAYLKVFAVLKEVRDASKVNRSTPIILGGLANVDLPSPHSYNKQVAVAISDSIAFLREHGLDGLVDGYGVHFYPSRLLKKGARRELLSVIHYLRQDSEMARARWRQ
jgi:hypothetical protein